VSDELLIAGAWVGGHGPTFQSKNPATGEILWQGHAASAEDVGAAISSAQAAATAWSERTVDDRAACLLRFSEALKANSDRVATSISREVGKPDWEALTEVNSMVGKVALSIEAHEKRCSDFRGGPAVVRFQPHGVVAVFGSFNFPGHLPNGHIVPALLAGNTVVFKPSEDAPLVAEETVRVWLESGLPDGVLNLVQGGRKTGEALGANDQIDGIFFTGSARTGIILNEAVARQPWKILALEMGGNNPLVVHKVHNRKAAVILTLQSAFLTAGQRCTCARRLIIEEGREGDIFFDDLVEAASAIRVGPHTDRPEPFMGPVISASATQSILAAQAEWVRKGAVPRLEAQHLKVGTGLLSPGIIDVTEMTDRGDEEVFGPLLQVVRVADFNAAIDEANRTAYGLASGLISDDATCYESFRKRIRAGLINWNQQLTGASGAVPFGGIGMSGNHRPSGFFAADYCSTPVASIEVPEVRMPASLPPGLVEDS